MRTYCARYPDGTLAGAIRAESDEDALHVATMTFGDDVRIVPCPDSVFRGDGHGRAGVWAA